ncbi:hypothetical protein Tco_1137444 [Tanacetum coccineum]
MAFDLRPTKDVLLWPGNANMAFDLRLTENVLPWPSNANIAFDLRPTTSGRDTDPWDTLVRLWDVKRTKTALQCLQAGQSTCVNTEVVLKVVRLGINPMIQPEPEDLPKDNPKLEIAVLRSKTVVDGNLKPIPCSIYEDILSRKAQDLKNKDVANSEYKLSNNAKG